MGCLERIRHSHLQGPVPFPAFMKDTLQHPGHAHEARGRVAGRTRYPLVTVPFLFLGQKEMAKIKHQYSIDELKHREAQMQARLEAEKAQREKLAEHKVPHRQLPRTQKYHESAGHIKQRSTGIPRTPKLVRHTAATGPNTYFLLCRAPITMSRGSSAQSPSPTPSPKRLS